ncbi:MAG: hypothetical protein WC302_00905 [Candidatus Paceibacterota bacterium]|jgi:hypothetical protein
MRSSEEDKMKREIERLKKKHSVMIDFMNQSNGFIGFVELSLADFPRLRIDLALEDRVIYQCFGDNKYHLHPEFEKTTTSEIKKVVEVKEDFKRSIEF